MSQAAYPGWRATLDGSEVPLYVGNHALLALPLPAGEHRVELRYWPTTWGTGLAAAGLGVALCLVAFLLPLLGRGGRTASERRA
jgi:uncharacterized membrane protein YfhO